MPRTINDITTNFALEPSEGLINKANPMKLFYRAQEKLGPVGGAAVGGVLGGLGGYYGSKALTNMAISLMFANKAPEERARIMESVKGNERLSRIGSIMGALGGVYFGGGRDLDFGDWDKFKTSLRDPEYWKSKGSLPDRVDKYNTKIHDKWYNSKLASEFGGYTSEIIPIKNSLDLIENDIFLDPYQKRTTSNLIFGAENKDSGLTSGQKLTRSAMTAGIAFAPAYAFGKVFGGVLGLPPQVRDRVSMVGGLAAAAARTGIFSSTL